MITEAQAEVLHLIATSEYHNGEDPVGNPTWTEVVMSYFDRTPRAFLGVLTSLQNAGLARATHATSRVGDVGDGTCWITQEGLDALNAYKANREEDAK